METAEETRVGIEPIEEGNEAGESSQQGNDEAFGPEPDPEPQPKEKAKRPATKTPRLVLAGKRAEQIVWAEVGIFNGTEREAKQQALASSEELQALYRDKMLALVAPPARGWNITTPEPEERIRGL